MTMTMTKTKTPVLPLPVTVDLGHIDLSNGDDTVFSILGAVNLAMKSAGIDQETRAIFQEEALSEDYDHLLTTVTQWVNVAA
jgi:hypothetical protein